jgi:acetyl-CoA carboxylase, biotin carboxylase subunit
MFKKILIANRGEIAVRIIHTCREMGIATVALYEQHDRGSLHVRLADESVQLKSDNGFNDIDAILKIARDKHADAIHPGYGFLAERQAFIDACGSAGITFIGPVIADGAQVMVSKRDILQQARDAGFQTVQFSDATFAIDEMDELRTTAEAMGYPLVIKSVSGGRGAGERLVRKAENLEEAVRRAQVESQTVYGSHRVYLEHAMLPAHQIGVEVLADTHGNIVHLGEHEGSIIYGNRKVVEESPSPNLTEAQRTVLHQTAIEQVRQFKYRGNVTVEFLADDSGNFYFTEFKNRIQTNHPVIEEVTSVDLVRQQIRLAAGEAGMCQGY